MIVGDERALQERSSPEFRAPSSLTMYPTFHPFLRSEDSLTFLIHAAIL